MEMVGNLLFILLYLMSMADGQYDDGDNRKCEPLTIPLCKQISSGYNLTTMPNLVNIDNQKDAIEQLKSYNSLFKIKCSKKVKLFICAMYAPMCTEVEKEVILIKPCKEMCINVRNDCHQFFKSINIPWPEVLKCENLPSESDENSLCMPDRGDDSKKDKEYNTGTGLEWSKILKDIKINRRTTTNTPSHTCSNRYTFVQQYNKCAPRCSIDILFLEKDKQFAKLWTLIWSGLCIVCTCLLLVTFLMDTNRFRYPERPIIAIAFCYCVFAVTHMVSVIIGRNNISCNDMDGIHYQHILMSGVTHKTSCIITFILSYYTTMASASWWVVLTITWFLAASHKWSREAISSVAVYCHMFAWSIPAIMTVSILAIRKVDGDLYIGLCGVGNLDRSSLTWFILVPLFTFLLIGIWFILAGYAAMCRIRNDLRSDGLNIRKLEKLMAKIGIFSIMYVVPVAISIACNFYITMRLPGWIKSSKLSECINPKCDLNRNIADTNVYLLRIFASLFVGTITGTWIWTSKTLETWRNFFSRSHNNVQGQKPTLTLETLRQHEALAKKDQTLYHPVNNDLAKL